MTKVFISYAHTDEVYRKELEKHLSVLKRNGYIDTWTDRQIIPGENWTHHISKELEEAKVILLLISSDFLASKYCYDIEMIRAIERHHNQEAIVVPIILRFCDWSDTPFAIIQGLPANAKPVKYWSDQDEAFLNIVEGIKVLLHSLQNRQLSEISHDPILNPQVRLSEIRRKLLAAENHRDINEVKFLLTEYKKNNTSSFEVEELERLINRSLVYEERIILNAAPTEHYKNMSEKMSHRPFSLLRLLLVIVLIIALVIILYHLLS